MKIITAVFFSASFSFASTEAVLKNLHQAFRDPTSYVTGLISQAATGAAVSLGSGLLLQKAATPATIPLLVGLHLVDGFDLLESILYIFNLKEELYIAKNIQPYNPLGITRYHLARSVQIDHLLKPSDSEAIDAYEAGKEAGSIAAMFCSGYQFLCQLKEISNIIARQFFPQQENSEPLRCVISLGEIKAGENPVKCSRCSAIFKLEHILHWFEISRCSCTQCGVFLHPGILLPIHGSKLPNTDTVIVPKSQDFIEFSTSEAFHKYLSEIIQQRSPEQLWQEDSRRRTLAMFIAGHLGEKAPEQAAELLRKLLEANPTAEQLWQKSNGGATLAMFMAEYLGEKAPEQAAELLRKLLKTNPTTEQLWQKSNGGGTLAMFMAQYLGEKAPEQAVELLRKLLETNPTTEQLWQKNKNGWTLAMFMAQYLGKKAPEQAVELLRKLLETNPTTEQLWQKNKNGWTLAMFIFGFLGEKAPEQAAELLHKLLETNPTTEQLWQKSNEGATLAMFIVLILGQKAPKQAVELLRKLLETNPTTEQLWQKSNGGGTLAMFIARSLGEKAPEQAAGLLSKLLETNPTTEQLWQKDSRGRTLATFIAGRLREKAPGQAAELLRKFWQQDNND